MHDAYIATTFLRHNRPLRGLLIDDQPWFVAHDLARLLGLHHPQALARRLDAHEARSVLLCAASGAEEWLEVVNEAALYKALIRFGHPENRALGRWLGEQVIPLLRDQGRVDPQRPRRVLMSWRSQRVTLLDWQGELWVPLQQLPTFSPCSGEGSGWLGRLRASL